jgi:hypothetical protein
VSLASLAHAPDALREYLRSHGVEDVAELDGGQVLKG